MKLKEVLLDLSINEVHLHIRSPKSYTLGHDYEYYCNLRIRRNLINGLPESYFINVGDCVTLSLSIPSHDCLLEYIMYDAKCNIYNNMKNGTGTKDMLDCALYLCYLLDDELSYIRLRDSSKKDMVSLWHSYISLHNKTWYEKYFKAYFYSSSQKTREKYDYCLTKLTDPEFKYKWTLDKVIEKTNTQILKFRTEYEITETISEFFRYIYTKNSKENIVQYTKLVEPFLEIFINNVIFDRNIDLINEYYRINTSDLNYANIDIEILPKKPEQRGGNIKKKVLYSYYSYKHLPN